MQRAITYVYKVECDIIFDMQENRLPNPPTPSPETQVNHVDHMIKQLKELVGESGKKFSKEMVDKLINGHRQLAPGQKATFIAAVGEIENIIETNVKNMNNWLQEMPFLQRLAKRGERKTVAQDLGKLRITLSELEHLKNAIASGGLEEWEDIMAREEKDRQPPLAHEELLDKIEILPGED